jgi:hypothetical protein
VLKAQYFFSDVVLEASVASVVDFLSLAMEGFSVLLDVHHAFNGAFEEAGDDVKSVSLMERSLAITADSDVTVVAKVL